MTKSILADKIAEKMKDLTKKQITIIIDNVFNSMKEALNKGEKIEIRGFGIFKAKQRKSKLARNPKTGQIVQVSDRRAIHFKVGKELHKALNEIKD
ncbi:MAG: integration host factor subunit beta [Thermodesulfovibrionales bacterium]|nr:integration host factor subunit beta [Thermodesulfovibrionales bacterium]